MSCRLLVRPSSDQPMVPADNCECADLVGTGTLFWLDVVSNDPVELDELGSIFDFAPGAVEDILDIEQLPKYDEYDNHLFVVLHALTSEGHRVDTQEVDCFIGDGLFVTVSAKPTPAIDWLWDAVQVHPHLSVEGSGSLFGELAEVLGRRYLEVIAEFESRIDEISDDALDADPDVLGDIQVLRREEVTVRKVLRPQRLVLAELRRHRGLRSQMGPFDMLGDAYDVHNQVVESLAEARSLLSDALDTYRGAAADRSAAATTILAVYSAIMLPLTLITGWYGMNLQRLPGSGHRWGWEAVSVAMAVIAIGSIAAFIRAGFIRPPDFGDSTVLRGLASAAKTPVKPFTMLRRPNRDKSSR